MPRLILPTTVVRASYLRGETETAREEGLPTTWLEEAAADFAGFVERRRAVRELWGVPVTELWFVDGTDYLGTVIIRHRLTPALEREAAMSATTSSPATAGAATPPRCSPRPSRSAGSSASPSSWSPAPRATSPHGG
jgi:hypothetical protein